jgi:hypothetical protein
VSEDHIHPFRKYFEEIQPGDSLLTLEIFAKRVNVIFAHLGAAYPLLADGRQHRWAALDPTMLATIGQQWVRGAQVSEDHIHPFRKYFEEIQPALHIVFHRTQSAELLSAAGAAGAAVHQLRQRRTVPQLVHGGPGRAGGGEELGGLRSVKHYMQRTAVQANRGRLTRPRTPRSVSEYDHARGRRRG